MEELKDKYIRFDWAIKRLLRQKANFGVLEGFLTVFIGEPIKIIDILESEGNQQEADDKFNRVDIKAKNSKGDIIIVEIQNTSELYYLERVLYGVAKAITEHCTKEGVGTVYCSDYTETEGGGISGTVGGRKVIVGNRRLMEKNGVDISQLSAHADRSAQNAQIPLFTSVDGAAAGVITVADPVKTTSKEAIDAFKRMKIKTVMLTGDNARTAEVIRTQLGIDEVYSELMPDDKSRIVTELQSKGGRVAMIGDGINDAPALAAADVGIAIGAGQDIAAQSADIVLMNSDLRDAVTSIRLSRAVIRNIKQNLFWALIYNTIGIPLAAGVFYSLLGWQLNPIFAAAAMSLSSVCVVTNALRLNFFKRERSDEPRVAQIPEIKESKNTEVNGKVKKTMKIEGMMCGHCTGTVSKLLNAIDGVSAEVSLEDKCAYITLDKEIPDEELSKPVIDAGYEVVSVTNS